MRDWGGPNAMTGVFIRRKFGRRPGHAGRAPCDDGDRDWGDASPRPRDTRDCQQPPEAGKIKEGSSPGPGERARPSVKTSGLQNQERIVSYCCK